MPTLKHLEGMEPSPYQLATVKVPSSVARRAETMSKLAVDGSVLTFSDGATGCRLKGTDIPIYISWSAAQPFLLPVYVPDGASRKWNSILQLKLSNYCLQGEYILNDARARAMEVTVKESEARYWRTIYHIREVFDGATQATFASDRGRHGLLTFVCNAETFLGSNPTKEEQQKFLNGVNQMAERVLELLNTIDLAVSEEQNKENL